MSDDLRLLGAVIAKAARSSPVPVCAVGLVKQVSLTGTGGEAQVMFGFSPDLVSVQAASWGAPFVAAVQADRYAVVGRRVLAMFPDGQPLILMTMGVA